MVSLPPPLSWPRPTRDGWIVLVGATGLAMVSWLSGNNLIYLVSAPIWAALIVSLPWGIANVQGVTVRRVLPAELYAGRDAVGQLLVLVQGRVRDLHLVDEGVGATTRLDLAEGGGPVALPARWSFPDRGSVRLVAVQLRSTFPFGLVEHRRRLALPAEVVVYPRPLPATAPLSPAVGAGADDAHISGGAGDLVELRPYRTGDSPRRVHWPTTARLGELVVVERATERTAVVEVQVRSASGEAWERELCRATGEIHRAFATGYEVGLRLPDVGGLPARHLPPSRGGMWRRALLDALALLPRIEA